MLVAFWFIRRDGLTRDVCTRLVAPSGASPWLWVVAVFLLPASFLVATVISIPFGYDISQFHAHWLTWGSDRRGERRSQDRVAVGVPSVHGRLRHPERADTVSTVAAAGPPSRRRPSAAS